MFVAVYDSCIVDAKDYINNKENEIFIQRVQGKTLDEIGKLIGVTRERIRQIEVNAIKKLDRLSVKFKEVLYADIFIRYVINEEDFIIAFCV